MKDLGTHGEDLLVSKYRELYWYLNELQTIAVTGDGEEIHTTKYYQDTEDQMANIAAVLGYVPAT